MGEVISSNGPFDVNLNMDSRNYPLGFYNRYVHDVFVDVPLRDFGGKLFSGYRVASGNWPIYYNYLNTLGGGAFVNGLELPLLKNRAIDAKRAKLYQNEIEHRKGLIERQERASKSSRRQQVRLIGGHRHNAWIGQREQRMPKLWSMNLQLVEQRMVNVAQAFYQHQIQPSRIQPSQQRIEGRQVGSGIFAKQGPALRRKDQCLSRARPSQAIRVFASYVGLEAVVCVLDRGDAQAACRQLSDEPFTQRGLARAAISDDPEHLHAQTLPRTALC